VKALQAFREIVTERAEVENWEPVREVLQKALSTYSKKFNAYNKVKTIGFHIEQDIYRSPKPEMVGEVLVIGKGYVKIIMSITHEIADTTKTVLLCNSVFGFQSEAEAETSDWKYQCYTGVLVDFIGCAHMVADARLQAEAREEVKIPISNIIAEA
jgi:hypothetical protein